MLLEAKNIGFRFGRDSWTFRGVTFTIHSGEVIGLVGPSGCGKTTLGRILAGYEQADEGRVTLNNDLLPIKGYHPVQLVFQHPDKAINPRWRIQDILNEGWKADQELLLSLGIEKEWLHRWPNELSGGELQRICIARALSPETRFLIADEMTTMLDAITQAQIWQVVLEKAEQHNIGVIVVSHDRNLIQRLCTRVIDLTEFKDFSK